MLRNDYIKRTQLLFILGGKIDFYPSNTEAFMVKTTTIAAIFSRTPLIFFEGFLL